MYEFHKGAVGYDLDFCLALKALVQDRINKSLVFEEDHPRVKCEFHTRIVGNSIEECKSFKLKLKKLIDMKSLAIKEEGSCAYVLISYPNNKKCKGPMNPLKVLFHKEKFEDVANEIPLFPCKRIKIPPWNSNVMTHANRSKGEVGDGSKRVMSSDKVEGKELEDSHANVDEFADPNLQMAKNEQLIMPSVPCQHPLLLIP